MFSHSLPLRMFDPSAGPLGEKDVCPCLDILEVEVTYIYIYISPVYIHITSTVRILFCVRVTILGEKTCISFFGDKTRWLAFAFFGFIGR